MKITRNFLNITSAFLICLTVALFLNFTSNLLPHEVEYSSGSGVRLSEIVNATPGTKDTKIVEIRKDEVAFIDKSIDVDQLVINGELHCDDSLAATNIEIKAKVIYVNGIFQCGVSSQRYSKNLIISLKHSAYPTTNATYRGFLVNPNAKVTLNGRIQAATWVKLAATAKPGQNSIQLTQAVQWKAGEKIVIAPSSYNPAEGETFLVKAVSGNTVTLNDTIKNQHWGLTEKYGTVVMDQRAEVANLSRNIMIRSDESTELIAETDTPGAQLGGHVMVMKGGQAYIDGVEFYRLGQAGVMARYPFHWHVVGNVQGQYIKNSSIHSSFQRCITVHGTQNALVQNNVCYDFKGHGFFLEDGTETGNTLKGNLGIWARHPSTSKILLSSDNRDVAKSKVVFDRFPAVSVFWNSHPGNTITGNTSAGSVGVGFWNSFNMEVRQFDPATKMYTGPVIDQPWLDPLLNFSNNTAHSGEVGMNWDGASIPITNTEMSMHNPNNPGDMKLQTSHYSPTIVPVISGLVIFKNKQTGIYYRGKTAVLDNLIMADNGTSLFFGYNQIVKNTTVIGRSKNHGPVEEKFLYSLKSTLVQKQQIGIKLYDGPFEIENIAFYAFSTAKDYRTIEGTQYDVTSRPMETVTGSDEYHNQSKNLKFSPEPIHRIFSSSSYGADKLMDLDGTVTGKPSILLATKSLSITSACVAGNPKYQGFEVCPPTLNDSNVYIRSKSDTPFTLIAGRADDATKLNFPMNTWASTLAVGRPSPFFSVINNKDYTYNVLLNTQSRMGNFVIRSSSDRPNVMTAAIRLIGYGSDCSLVGATKANSLANLRLATSTSYYSAGNEFYVRLQTVRPLFNGNMITASKYGTTTASESAVFNVVCNKPVVAQSLGSASASGLSISGWACEFGNFAPSDVNFYVGGPKGSGVLLPKAVANLVSVPNVGFACGGTLNHNYKMTLTPAVAVKYHGKQIYAYSKKTSEVLIVTPQKMTIDCPTTANCKISNVAPPLTSVKFGAGTKLVVKAFAPNKEILCSYTAFGSDPAPGVMKACFTSSDVKIVNEGDKFICTGPTACAKVADQLNPMKVKFGANGIFATVSFPPATIVTCSSALFGDPVPNVFKACYNEQNELIAAEGEKFTFTCINSAKCQVVKVGAVIKSVIIKYGTPQSFKTKTFNSGASVLCSNVTFDGDPAPYIAKACYTQEGIKLVDEGTSFIVK